MAEPPRPFEQRRKDTLARLETDVDAWIATADAETGEPYLVPLSYAWDGASLLLATPGTNPTARNFQATGRVRIGIGPTRDVVLIEGEARMLAEGELTQEEGDRYTQHTGWDPREVPGNRWFRVRPLSIQAWREANELKGRFLMTAGEWKDPFAASSTTPDPQAP